MEAMAFKLSWFVKIWQRKKTEILLGSLLPLWRYLICQTLRSPRTEICWSVACADMTEMLIIVDLTHGWWILLVLTWIHLLSKSILNQCRGWIETRFIHKVKVLALLKQEIRPFQLAHFTSWNSSGRPVATSDCFCCVGSQMCTFALWFHLTIVSLAMVPTASHSTSQLSQKLKTTYKASTSKVWSWVLSTHSLTLMTENEIHSSLGLAVCVCSRDTPLFGKIHSFCTSLWVKQLSFTYLQFIQTSLSLMVALLVAGMSMVSCHITLENLHV